MTVAVDGDGVPVAVKALDGWTVGSLDVKIEVVREAWRIDDEWWRQPIARQYVEAVLEGGKRVVLFQDLLTGSWFMQQP